MKNRALPPLGWFRVFESAARLLSFTAAADELGLTQSAVSQQIRALEERFGCALFIRKPRGIALTDNGRRLLPGVSDGISNLRIAVEAFEPATDPELLTVATSVSIAQWFLAPLLQEFLAQNKQARVRIVTAVWPDEFISSSADVHIRYCPIDSADKNAKALGNNQIALFAAPACISNQPKRQNVAQLIKNTPLIQAVGTADTWERFAQLAKLPIDKRVTTYVDSHGLAVDVAQSGSGMALTSMLIAAPSVISGKLQLLHNQTMPAKDGYFIDTTNHRDNELAQRFTAWLQKHAEQAEFEAYAKPPPAPTEPR